MLTDRISTPESPNQGCSASRVQHGGTIGLGMPTEEHAEPPTPRHWSGLSSPSTTLFISESLMGLTVLATVTAGRHDSAHGKNPTRRHSGATGSPDRCLQPPAAQCSPALPRAPQRSPVLPSSPGPGPIKLLRNVCLL